VYILKGSKSRESKAAAAIITASTENASIFSSSSSISSSTTSQSLLRSSINEYKDQEFEDSIARFFAVSYTALHVVEMEEFVDMMMKFRTKVSTTLPTRKSLKQLQYNLAQRSKELILQRTSRSEFPSALALDGWTNCVQSKVTNVLLLSQGNSYFLNSYENVCEANTSDNLYKLILPLLDGLTNKKVKITGIVMDNASVNIKLFHLLKNPYPHLIRLPCSAHLVQLCVKQIIKLSGIREIIEFMELILNTFRSNSAYTRRLRMLQLGFDDEIENHMDNSASTCMNNDEMTVSEIDIEKNIPNSFVDNEVIHSVSEPNPTQEEHTTYSLRKRTAYTLLRPVDTRWSSSLIAAKRILKLKTDIDYVARIYECSDIYERGIKDHLWEKLSNLILVLEPFKIATDILQADSSNLFTIYGCFHRLLSSIETASLTNLDFDFSSIKDIVINYWRKHINLEATIMSAILSMEKSHESVFTEDEIGNAKKWFITFCVDYLSKYNTTATGSGFDTDILSGKIIVQYGKFRGCMPPFDNIHDLIAKTSTSNLNPKSRTVFTHGNTQSPSSTFDPKIIWNYYIDEARELSTCAIAILSLPSSEAAVERSFSKQGITHRKSRNRLSAEQIETEMTINYNTRMHKNKSTDYSLVPVADLETNIDGDAVGSSVKLFNLSTEDCDEIEIEMGEEYLSDVGASPTVTSSSISRPNKRKAPISISSNPHPIHLPIINQSLTEVPPPKRRVGERSRVGDRAEMIIPYEDIANRNQFIKSYVEQREKELQHRITSTIRWTETTVAHLQLALSEWKPYIRDTDEEVQRHLNLFIKEKLKALSDGSESSPIDASIESNETVM
jgi:Protein of unknown function (DUF 659)/hAT family C-terminal dimerisation region